MLSDIASTMLGFIAKSVRPRERQSYYSDWLPRADDEDCTKRQVRQVDRCQSALTVRYRQSRQCGFMHIAYGREDAIFVRDARANRYGRA